MPAKKPKQTPSPSPTRGRSTEPHHLSFFSKSPKTPLAPLTTTSVPSPVAQSAGTTIFTPSKTPTSASGSTTPLLPSDLSTKQDHSHTSPRSEEVTPTVSAANSTSTTPRLTERDLYHSSSSSASLSFNEQTPIPTPRANSPTVSLSRTSSRASHVTSRRGSLSSSSRPASAEGRLSPSPIRRAPACPLRKKTSLSSTAVSQVGDLGDADSTEEETDTPPGLELDLHSSTEESSLYGPGSPSPSSSSSSEFEDEDEEVKEDGKAGQVYKVLATLRNAQQGAERHLRRNKQLVGMKKRVLGGGGAGSGNPLRRES